MKAIKLDTMTAKELEHLQVVVAEAIVERKAQERAEIREKLAALAHKSGFALDELFGKPSKNGTGLRGKVAPKYRNPADTSETWTGRGRMPLWLKALTEKGARREKYLIK